MIFTRKILWAQPGTSLNRDGITEEENKEGKMEAHMEDRNEMRYLDELTERYPCLNVVKSQILEAYRILETCFEQGGKLLVAGNGGSAADSEHIVGELMKGFVKKRQVPREFASALKAVDEEKGAELAKKLQGGLPAIALSGHPGLSTAYLNDVDGDLVYAQQTYGYGRINDVLLGISTSGNSKNVDYAVIAAKAIGMKVIGLTGKDGGRLGKSADAAIIVPEQETYKIQELHLPIYHALCLMLEEHFFES
ncbi:MAG: SIS domain-containing protein [Clostridiaceae bacterium]|nr:SIS domain-containing protein [Clostridiaceae bacterium]